MRYAINLADLLAFKNANPMIHAILVRPRLTQETVKVSADRMDDVAVLLMEDNATPGQAQAICEVLRKKMARHALRMYRSATGRGGWERI